MVFGGQLTFSTPPKTISAPKNVFGPKCFFRPHHFFSAVRNESRSPDTWAPALGPILKGGVGGREGGKGGGNPLKTKKNSPPTKNGLEIKISAWAGDQSAFCFVFGTQNQKSAFPAGAEEAKA